VTRGQRLALLALLALLTAFALPPPATSAADALGDQLRSRGIHDPRVLAAFDHVPRAAFAPPEVRNRAADDAALPIGHGQTMSQPYVVALMTELLGLKGDERVLEIGTGSGYSAAILSEVARDVYSVEIVPELASAARLRLTREGYRNVHVKQGDGTFGWRDYGPYDAVVVTAAAPTVPRALIDQLREGGVLVMPLGEPAGRQVLVRGVKRGTKLRTREITEVRFVPMIRGPAERAPGAAPDERAPATRAREDREPPPRVSAPPDAGARGRRDVIEEELPDREREEPESAPRSRRDVRDRVARVPSARASDRRCATGGADRAAAGSRAVAPRCAG
jgi:protein-L-isoaspartate(D-aspartate) O-methyltransferase